MHRLFFIKGGGGVASPLNYPTLRGGGGSGGLNPSPSRNFLKSEEKEVERKKRLLVRRKKLTPHMEKFSF